MVGVALALDEYGATAESWVEWKASAVLWMIAAIPLVFGWLQRRIPFGRLLDVFGK